MWRRSAAGYAARAAISLREALQFQCTAEHLQALAEGGKTNSANIAAACLACNQGRHADGVRRSSAAYKAVKDQMAGR
jgi:hypothetical protein